MGVVGGDGEVDDGMVCAVEGAVEGRYRRPVVVVVVHVDVGCQAVSRVGSCCHVAQVTDGGDEIRVLLASVATLGKLDERQFIEVEVVVLRVVVVVGHEQLVLGVAHVDHRGRAEGLVVVAAEGAQDGAVLLGNLQDVVDLVGAVGASLLGDVDILHLVVRIEEIGVERDVVDQRREVLTLLSEVELGVVVQRQVGVVPSDACDDVALLVFGCVAHVDDILVSLVVLSRGIAVDGGGDSLAVDHGREERPLLTGRHVDHLDLLPLLQGLEECHLLAFALHVVEVEPLVLGCVLADSLQSLCLVVVEVEVVGVLVRLQVVVHPRHDVAELVLRPEISLAQVVVAHASEGCHAIDALRRLLDGHGDGIDQAVVAVVGLEYEVVVGRDDDVLRIVLRHGAVGRVILCDDVVGLVLDDEAVDVGAVHVVDVFKGDIERVLHVGLVLAPCGRCDEVDGDILLAVDNFLDRQDETLVGVPSLGGVEEHSASLALIGDSAAVDVVGAGDVAVLVVVLGIAHGVDGDHGLDGGVVAVEHLLGQCAVHLDAVHL